MLFRGKCICVFVVCVLYYEVSLLMRSSYWVSFSVYTWTYFKDMIWHFLKSVPEVWIIFVRRILCDLLGFGGIWVLNDPPRHHHHPHPTPIPGVNVKVPFQRKKHKLLFCDFLWFLWKSRKLKNVLKWLRRVAFVGWDTYSPMLAYFSNQNSTWIFFLLKQFNLHCWHLFPKQIHQTVKHLCAASLKTMNMILCR